MKGPGILFTISLFLTTLVLPAYEVTLQGGARLDIPEAWILDRTDPAVPAWDAPDHRAEAEITLWAPGTWDNIQAFLDEIKPAGAEGDALSFSWWGGEAALADWTFPGVVDNPGSGRYRTEGGLDRGWFLLVRGTSGPDVCVSATASAQDFIQQQSFLLSVLDSYIPSEEFRLVPGAVSRFLELTGPEGTAVARTLFEGAPLSWEESPAGNMAAQDVIEREAIVLSAYAGVPELFYPAWQRYYRLIYRDGYTRLDGLADALDNGPLPVDQTDRTDAAERLLAWLQSFEYGSVDRFSDLLAPSAAVSAALGDCDSLSLVLLMLLDRYGVDGRFLLTHQAHHAIAALDLSGEGMRYQDEQGSWLVAELTTEIPLGRLPDRLHGVSDWFAVDLLTEGVPE